MGLFITDFEFFHTSGPIWPNLAQKHKIPVLAFVNAFCMLFLLSRRFNSGNDDGYPYFMQPSPPGMYSIHRYIDGRVSSEEAVYLTTT